MKILFLAANPQGTAHLQLDTEIKRIDDSLKRSKLRDQFQIVSQWAVDSMALRRALLDEKPHIVHFSGHGEGQSGLVLMGQDRQPRPATAAALSGLFKTPIIAENLKCVLLNACYAEVQAKAIVQHIDYAIGMRQAVRDDAAIAFSTGFYDGLGYGLSIEDAFDLGCNAIQFELASFSAAPRSFTVIPVDCVEVDNEIEPLTDDRIPVLLKRKIRQVENQTENQIPTPSPDISLSEKIRAEDTSRSDAVKQYQAQVKIFLADPEQTSAKVFQLALLATRLGLSEIEANCILEEERSAKQFAQQLTSIYPQPPPDSPEPISEAALQIALSHNLSQWRRVVSSLSDNPAKVRIELFRQFQFNSFLDAIAFMNQFALDCEFTIHHPRWENTWKTLNVYLTTWDIGHQISDRDVQLAKSLEQSFASFSGAAIASSKVVYPIPPPEVPVPISEAVLNIALSTSLLQWKKVISPLPEDSSRVRVELFRRYRFDSFLDAIAFMNQVAPRCERAMHHPRWENIWWTLNVYLTTWDIGHQISDRDVQLAKALDQVFSTFPGAKL